MSLVKKNSRRGFAEVFLITSRILYESLHSFRAFPLRSVFVILAIAFGSSSLTIISTALDNTSVVVDELVADFGPDAMMIIGGDQIVTAVGGRGMTLTKEDVERISNNINSVEYVVPLQGTVGNDVVYKGKSARHPFVVGSLADFAKSWDWPLTEGRDLNDKDVENGAKVTVLGSKVKEALFENESPIGKQIRVGQSSFTVIGVLEERGAFSGQEHVDNRIIIPFSTLVSRFPVDRNHFQIIRVRFNDSEAISRYTEEIRSLLRYLHRLEDHEEDDFFLLSSDEILVFVGIFKGGLTLFLGMTAVCSMLVGGFVLANLFSLSVESRYVEIGIKKAVGARKSDITVQFLFEACLLTVVGGFIGGIIGIVVSFYISSLGVMQVGFSIYPFLLSLSVSFVIGIIFALKPARTAANLDVIAALRGN